MYPYEQQMKILFCNTHEIKSGLIKDLSGKDKIINTGKYLYDIRVENDLYLLASVGV